MNINYLEYINTAHKLLEKKQISSTSQLFYFKLLDIWNKLYFPKEFEVTNKELLNRIWIKKINIIHRCRDELQNNGLIIYKKGLNNSKISEYKIIDLTKNALTERNYQDENTLTESNQVLNQKDKEALTKRTTFINNKPINHTHIIKIADSELKKLMLGEYNNIELNISDYNELLEYANGSKENLMNNINQLSRKIYDGTEKNNIDFKNRIRTYLDYYKPPNKFKKYNNTNNKDREQRSFKEYDLDKLFL